MGKGALSLTEFRTYARMGSLISFTGLSFGCLLPLTGQDIFALCNPPRPSPPAQSSLTDAPGR